MLIFLKLGGSLITNKDLPNTARQLVLNRIAGEISNALQHDKQIKLLIGHGSGSFGHVAGKKYGTRKGVHSKHQWNGFIKVWKAARDLNQIVLEELLKSGLNAISIPPSAFITTTNQELKTWNPQPIQAALDADLIPLVQGDVIFDDQLGGTILSTEEIFKLLAPQLKPERILIAGQDEGVWSDYPQCHQLISEIHTENYDELHPLIGGSSSTDVTGGMAEKVRSMISLVDTLPTTEVLIFSGAQAQNIFKTLSGTRIGTLIKKNR